MNTRALTAEFIGTFALIFIGAGAGALGIGGLVGVALAHGFVVLGFAYAHGHISGTHINPAVTTSLLVAGEIDVSTAVQYWVAQLLGGTAGAFALAHALGGTPNDLGATMLAPDVSISQGFIIEFVLTFFLANAVLNCAVSGKAGNLAGVAIGCTLVFCILMGGPLTGASLNPARSLGPALVTQHMGNLWLYFVAPMSGGAAAALLYTGLLKSDD
ncbi:MAG: aquaporin family protein [Acidobacteria bacterium]|nr:aquaporin family protein [Acidobacteriota bacterium]